MKLQRNQIKNCRAKKRERLFLEIWWLARSAHVEDSESELVRERERVREIRLNPKNLGVKSTKRLDLVFAILYENESPRRTGLLGRIRNLWAYWATLLLFTTLPFGLPLINIMIHILIMILT